MDLKVYLATEDMTIKEFSELINFSRIYVSLIMHGHRGPSKNFCKVVTDVTGGKVTLQDFQKKKEYKDNKKNKR